MTCPKCSVDREVVGEMLAEDCETDDFWAAVAIVRSCSECRIFFNGKQEVASNAKAIQ